MDGVSDKAKTGNKWLSAVLCVLLASVFPVVFLWGNNAGLIVNAKTVLVPLLLFAAAGLVVFLLFALFSRGQANKSALCAVVAIVLLSNFSAIWDFISRIVAGFYYWHTATLCAVIIAVLSAVIYRRLKDETAAVIVRALSVAFACLLAFNIALGLPAVFASMKGRSGAEETAQGVSAGKPNVYFMIFDEFSNFEFAEKWLGYDNAVLLEALESKGFNISHTSMNECLRTERITVNLLNMDYLLKSDETPPAAVGEKAQLSELRKNSVFFNDFLNAGYRILATGTHTSSYYSLPVGGDAARESAATVTGESFSDILLNRTFLFFVDSEVSTEHARDIFASVDFFMSYDNFADGSCLAFCHFNTPHAPYIFDENGDYLDISCYSNCEYSLGQYIYVSKLIDEMAAEIIKNDPNSVIILMSDHSDRQISGYSDEARNVFNAVYFMGKELDIEGLSGINTLRLICNEFLGKGYAPVPLENYFVEEGEGQ